MATEAQVKAWVAASGRDWNQKCQALMYQICANLGSAPVVYSSAAAARAASTIVGTNPADAQPGDFHQFDIGTYDHVALSLGGSRCLMGSTHVGEKWGTNAGVTTVEAYCRATGARYLGFSHSNGRNDVAITAPPAAGLAPTQRKVRAGINVNRRTGPGVNFPTTGEDLKPGTIGNFVGHALGPVNAAGALGEWFKGISGSWFVASAFEDAGTHDLADLNPPPVVVPPVVVEPPVVAPEPEPPVVVDPPVIVPAPPVEPTPEPEPPVIEPEPTPEPPVDPVEPTPEPEPPVVVDPPVIVPPAVDKPVPGSKLGAIVTGVILALIAIGTAIAALFH